MMEEEPLRPRREPDLDADGVLKTARRAMHLEHRMCQHRAAMEELARDLRLAYEAHAERIERSVGSKNPLERDAALALRPHFDAAGIELLMRTATRAIETGDAR